MPKTLDDVKAILMKDADGVELYEAVSNAVLQERNLGKGLVRDTQNKLTKAIDALKRIGVDPTSGDLDASMIDLKAKLDKAQELEASLTEKEKKVTGTTAEIQRLEKAIKTMQDERIADRAKAEKAERSLRNRQIKDAVVPRMKDRIFSADIRAERLIESGMIDMDETGKIIYKHNGESLDLEKGLEEYFKEPSNKDDLKNSQLPGAGTNGSAADRNVKSMARADFDKLGPEERANFLLKEKGNIV